MLRRSRRGRGERRSLLVTHAGKGLGTGVRHSDFKRRRVRRFQQAGPMRIRRLRGKAGRERLGWGQVGDKFQMLNFG